MRWPTLDMSREAPMNATDRGLKKGWSEAVVKTRSRISDRLTLSWLGATEKSISTHSSSTFEWSGKPDRRNGFVRFWALTRIETQLMLETFRRSGFPLHSKVEDECVEIDLKPRSGRSRSG